MTQVKCSVANCDYWAKGNLCAAEEIMVEIDAHTGANYKEEFAGEHGQGNQHQDQAGTSSQTCCQTFKPKQSGK